jgi:chorismate-pyruvate lyase
MLNTAAKPTSGPFAPRTSYSDVYPLDAFYEQRGEDLPVIGRIKADEIPDPYRALLADSDDITAKLRNFYKETIHIRVLQRHVFENEYFREVVLTLNGTEKPIAFAAIKIVLDLFPNAAQQEIIAEKRPLPRILREHQIPHFSRTKSFLTVTADRLISAALNLSDGHTLYGRRNTIVDPWERPLAETVEVLAP